MGREVERDSFEDSDYARFSKRLRENLSGLSALLQRPGFGDGETTIGAEMELSLVDGAGGPLPLNQNVVDEVGDPHLALEVDRFNLEYNTLPVPLSGKPFSTLGAALDGALNSIAAASSRHGGRPVTIGILPTLCAADLDAWVLTDKKRYRALSDAVRRLRRGPMNIEILGREPLTVRCDGVTMEGANTSFQLHLRVHPEAFARTFNAAQIASGPVLAAAGNSPVFLGRLLWEETRVMLFRQAVDERSRGEEWLPARVSFGHGWVRRSAHELFAEAVALHPPLLPVVRGTSDSVACVAAGGTPDLEELRLHQGTVWHWNRAIYDCAGGGHLRIELRALPSGPSVPDMLANAALLLGLTLGLAPEIEQLLAALPFTHARENFYAAAELGLDARLYWPCDTAPSPRSVRARDLLPTLLPIARRGLLGTGVDPDEVDRLLAIIAERVRSGITGAQWQQRALAQIERRAPRREALVAMLERYLEHSAGGSPVHLWPL